MGIHFSRGSVSTKSLFRLAVYSIHQITRVQSSKVCNLLSGCIMVSSINTSHKVKGSIQLSKASQNILLQTILILCCLYFRIGIFLLLKTPIELDYIDLYIFTVTEINFELLAFPLIEIIILYQMSEKRMQQQQICLTPARYIL